MDLPAKLGPYELHAELGRGGMGVVYLAHDPRLGRDVAIKVLPPELAGDPTTAARFLSEARSAASLDHPSIARIYDVGGDDHGPTYFAMEFVPGGSVKTRLAGQPMDFDRAVAVLRPLAEAIDYAHRHQVIHRDIKPENVLLTLDGRPVLVDFGIARVGSGRGLTVTGMMIGTPEYMSPEQAAGQDVDWRTDLYSFGVLTWALLAGRPPFTGESVVSVAVKHLQELPPDVRPLNPSVPAAAELALQRMMAKSPDERFGSATEFVQALQGQTAAPLTPLRAAPRERRAVAAVVALLLLGLVALAWPGLHSRSPAITVPVLAGWTLPQAATALSDLGVSYEVNRQESPQAAEVILSQTPRPGPVSRGTTVLLAVSSGPPAAPATRAVPSVVGQDSAAARRAIEAQGLRIGAVEQRLDPSCGRGLVVSQRPAADAQVTAGTAVDLIVSKGSPLTESQVGALVQRWLDAQNRRDVSAYKACYAMDLVGIKRSPGGSVSRYSYGAWLTDRSKMLRETNGLTVTIQDLRISVNGADGEARFVQTFTTSRFGDRGDKLLRVRMTDAGPLICYEEMLNSVSVR